MDEQIDQQTDQQSVEPAVPDASDPVRDIVRDTHRDGDRDGDRVRDTAPEASAIPEAGSYSVTHPAASSAVPQLSERVEARLAELDNRPVSAHGEVYAAIHAELSQALERLDA